MFDSIEVSDLFTVSINLLCLNTWSNSCKFSVLKFVIAVCTNDLILAAVLVVDLASYLTVTVGCINVVSGSSITGVILATLKSFSWVIISDLVASVSVAPATGLIEIYTRPYTGVSLSSPPHTWTDLAFE